MGSSGGEVVSTELNWVNGIYHIRPPEITAPSWKGNGTERLLFRVNFRVD